MRFISITAQVIRKYNHSHSQLIHQSTIPSYQAILRDESDSIHHLSICCLYIITINEYIYIYVCIYICVHSRAYQRIALYAYMLFCGLTKWKFVSFFSFYKQIPSCTCSRQQTTIYIYFMLMLFNYHETMVGYRSVVMNAANRCLPRWRMYCCCSYL